MSPFILIGGIAGLLMAYGKPKVKSSKKGSCGSILPGSGNLSGYNYIEFTTGGASLDERLPIIFFLHSRNSSPKSLKKYIDSIPVRARIVMPIGNLSTPSSPLWFELPARTEDQDELARQMGEEAVKLTKFINNANYCLMGVGKPIVTGFSQGGEMTLAVAARSPQSIKRAIVVSGWLPVKLWPNRFPPISIIHGVNDTVVDYSRTADFVSRAKGAGLDIDFYPVSGQSHSLSGEINEIWHSILIGSIDD